MSTQELIIKEISTMSEQQLTEILNHIQSIKDTEKVKPSHKKASGQSILRHAGKWQGNDLKDCLEMVQASRGLAEF